MNLVIHDMEQAKLFDLPKIQSFKQFWKLPNWCLTMGQNSALEAWLPWWSSACFAHPEFLKPTELLQVGLLAQGGAAHIIQADLADLNGCGISSSPQIPIFSGRGTTTLHGRDQFAHTFKVQASSRLKP